MDSFNTIIDKNFNSILSLVSNNLVVKIVSGPNTGKSTKLPIKLCEEGYKVYVIVDHDSIAKSLSSFTSKITSVSVGNETNFQSNKQLVYISSENFKKSMYLQYQNNCTDLNNIMDIIIIDELDRGSVNNYINISLWRNCLEKLNNNGPKLVLNSNREYSIFPDYPTYEIKTSNKVEVRYWNKNYNLECNNKSLVKDVSNLIYDLHNSSMNGNFLVYALNDNQVDNIASTLNSYSMNNTSIIPIYKQFKPFTLDLKNNDRKIIISSNLGLSFDNIELLIDTMIEEKIHTTLTGGKRSIVSYISQHSANSRSMKSNNLCYRMITQKLYSNLDIHTSEDINKYPLHHVMLELYENNVNPYDILQPLFDSDALDFMKEYMIKFNLIDDNYNITNVGKFIKRLPLGLRLSICLFEWIQNNDYVYPGIVVMSLIDNYADDYFIWPINDENTILAEFNIERVEYTKEYFNRFRGNSDVHTYLNIWTTMTKEIKELKDEFITKWCNDNNINSKRMIQTKNIINDIINICSVENLNTGIVSFTNTKTTDLLSPIIEKVYPDKKYNLETENKYKDSYGNYYTNDSDSINNIDKNAPLILYGIITSTVKSDYGDFNYLSCSFVSNDVERLKIDSGTISF